MSGSWFDLNSAEQQRDYELIPKGTLAWVRMDIKPGGYNDPTMGWDGGYATKSKSSDAIYIDCEAVIMDGPYAKRRIYYKIGLYSPKGELWGNMGRTLVRTIIESARKIKKTDTSPEAQEKRKILSIKDIDGIYFLARIDTEKDQSTGDERNTIKAAITPDMKAYYDLDQSQRIAPMPTTDAAPSAGAAPGWAGGPPPQQPSSSTPAWAQ